MRQPPAALVVTIAACLAATACSDGGTGARGPGMVVAADGRMYANTDRNQRDETVHHLHEDLAQALGPAWSTTVEIPELPIWQPDAVGEGGDWRWRTCTARVVLTGTGEPPVPPAQIETEIRSYLARRSAAVAVTVEKRAPVVAVTAAVAAAPATAPSAAETAGPRTYHIQPGDTLGDISTVFYGSPEHWRRIVEANPGLDPAHLAVGRELVIPPKP